jgi:hypothetical protein
MFLDFNITDEDKLLLTDQASVTSLNICNTGPDDATMSLYKQNIGSGEKFYFLKDVLLKKKYVFLAENMVLNNGDDFRVLIDGTCSVIIDFT